MKQVVCFLLSLVLLGLTSPSVSAADSINKKLNLMSPIPQKVASSTITVDLQPSNYSSEYKKLRTIVYVCSKAGELCGNWEINKYPDPNPIKLNVDGDYRAPNVYVLGVNDNRIVFSFEKVGKYYVRIVKRFSREIESLDPSFRGNVNTEWTYEEIEFPVEITDISKGGIDIRDLAAAGIKINPYPILNCPEKIKNIKQTIRCNLSYGYEDPAYSVLYEPFETFKICAYKNADDLLDCKLKNPYLLRDIKINLNTIEEINIPIYKDVDTSIEMVPIIEGKFPEFMDTFGSQYYFFKPKKYAPAKKGNSGNGKWVKKCKTITIKEVPRPGELTDMVLNGGYGPKTYTKLECENVWVP
jgi:hypothetical protein